MRKLICWALLLAAIPVTAQVTVTTATSGGSPVHPFGVNSGGYTYYDQGMNLKNFFRVLGGDMNSVYNDTSMSCYSGSTATSWVVPLYPTTGYPLNYWANATFDARNGSTGNSYGTGTITASTASAGASTLTLTLNYTSGTATTCVSGQDLLLVRFENQVPTNIPPSYTLSTRISGGTFDTADTSPASSNTTQSLQMTNGLTLQFDIDGSANNTNTNSALAASPQDFVNLNGTYTFTFKAKCKTSGCGLTYGLQRNGTACYLGSGGGCAQIAASPALTYSATNGVGWQTYSFSFTANETGSQVIQPVQLNMTFSGTVDIQDIQLNEGSTLSGNTTIFRDDYVRYMEEMNVGSIRFMEGADWCSRVNDQLLSGGNVRWCNFDPYDATDNAMPLSYNDELSLCYVVGVDCWITVGQFNTNADWTTLSNWMNTSGWTTKFQGIGHAVYFEDGNETWNASQKGTISIAQQAAYGQLLGGHMHAFKAGSGYNASVTKLVGSAEFGNGTGIYSQGYIILNNAGCSLSTTSYCPDFLDNALYQFNWIGNYTTSFGNVAPTGAPFEDALAEAVNFTTPTTISGSKQLYAQANYLRSTFGVDLAIYEWNFGTGDGVTLNQYNDNQITGSAGEAEAVTLAGILAQRDDAISGPMNLFTLGQNSNGYSTCSGTSCSNSGNPANPLWGLVRSLPCGPGQLSSCNPVYRPISILTSLINGALVTHPYIMPATFSGVPTLNYAGGQNCAFGTLNIYACPTTGNTNGNQVPANSSVGQVQCAQYGNAASSPSSVAMICYNLQLGSSATFTLAGGAPPTGTVTETIYPNQTQGVQSVTASGGSGMTAGTYALSFSGGGCSGAAGKITVTASAVSLIQLTSYGTGCTSAPTVTAATGGTPPTLTASLGGELLTANNENSFIGGTGSLSPLDTAPTPSSTSGTSYSICAGCVVILTYGTSGTPTAATPTFSPAAGSYGSAQTVTISSSTSGATICYTTNGTTPAATTAGTCSTGSTYSTPITVSTTETVQAIATESGYVNSSVGSAAYTIGLPTAATPTFSPAAGSYGSAQTVTISSSTSGATICYTTNGTTPAATTAGTCSTGSTYSAPITVSVTETVQALATESGYNNSSVGSAAYTISAGAVSNAVLSGHAVLTGNVQLQ